MAATITLNPSSIFDKKRKLPKNLGKYENADFAIKQRVRFVYNLCILIMVSIILITLYSGYIQTIGTAYKGLYLPILIPEIAMFGITFLCLMLIIKGYYSISIHLLFTSSMATVWAVIWFDKNEAIARLDTIVFILTILTMIPLLINKYKTGIIYYLSANIALLVIFLLFNKENLGLNNASLIDYFADNTISLIAVCLIGYSIFNINKRSTEQIAYDIEEKFKSEEKLKESDKAYQYMFDKNPQPMIIYNLEDLSILEVNSAATKHYGYSKEEFLSFSLKDIHLKEDIQSLIDDINNISDAYSNRSYARHLKKNGNIIYVELSAHSISYRNFKARHVLINDITERKRMNELLQASELRYKTLIETSHDGISLMDLNWNILFVNRRKAEMVRASSKDSLIGANSIMFFSEKSRLAITDAMPKILQQGFIDNFEAEVLRLDGTTFHAEFNLTVLKDDNGKPLNLMDTMRDITDRKVVETELEHHRNHLETLVKERTEELEAAYEKLVSKNEELHKLQIELLNEKKLIDSLMETIPDAIYFKDLQSRFIKISKSMYNYLGDNKNIDIIGKTDFDIFTEEHARPAFETEQEIIKNGKPIINLIEKETWKNGRITYASTSKMPLKNTSGVIVGTFGISHDITKLIEMEEEIKKQNNILITQRRELEITLNELKKAQTNLIQSEKMASLGILAAGVAHEINNPLNFIYGGIAGIEDYFNENLKDHLNEVAPLIEGINIGVKRAADIVTSLNHYCRKDDLPSTICDIHSIIDNCLVMLNNKIKNKVTIIKNYTSDDFSVLCNEGRLHQVFLNIIANSIQSIEHNGTITVLTHIKGEQIFIKISDTGCGIEKEIIHKITDPFFTTKDPGQGTGLGLSITNNIIKEYNGTLYFESKVGEGTEAIITLPIIKSQI